MQDLFSTERLIIRRFQETDGDDLYRYLSDRETVKYEPYDVFTKEQAQEEAKRRAANPAFWAVCLKNSNTLIGNVYFELQKPEKFKTWEIGYVFNRDFGGKGYATEAVAEILKYGFEECNAHRIEAYCSSANESSWKLLERLTMRREGYFPQKVYFKYDEDGQPMWHDTYVYGMLGREWPQGNQ